MNQHDIINIIDTTSREYINALENDPEISIQEYQHAIVHLGHYVWWLKETFDRKINPEKYIKEIDLTKQNFNGGKYGN